MLIELVPINVNPGLGNQIFRLIFSYFVETRIGGAVTIEFPIPELNFCGNPHYYEKLSQVGRHRNAILTTSNFQKPNTSETQILGVDGFGYHKEFYTPVLNRINSVLPKDLMSHRRNQLLLKDRILVQVRGSDIWKKYSFDGATTKKNVVGRYFSKAHPDYYAQSISYLENVQTISGKRLAMLIELPSPKWYLRALEDKFGRESMYFSKDLLSDFATFCAAENIALSTSTLSWIACLLFRKELVIYPELGIFDSLRRPDIGFTIAADKVVSVNQISYVRKGNLRDKKWILKNNQESA